MKDLKIRVTTEAKSKEVQELFFKLGYYWAYKNLGKKLLLSKNDVYLFAGSDGTLGTGTHQDEVFFNNWFGKEITLQELRDMVNQDQDEPFLTPETTLNDQYAEIEEVRKQTIEATLAERQSQYGCFEDVARATGKIMEALSGVRVNGLSDLPYPHRMALYMIASKMARIVNGDFNHKDGWHDIGGYSKLVEDLL